LALVETCSMPMHVRRVLAVLAVLLIPVIGVSAATPVVAAPAPAIHVTGTPPPAPVPTDNPFIPPDKDLSTCVSANPQPGCGSKAHGGWRQFLTFVVVALGMAFIGWRIVHTVRRNRKLLETSGRP
jgi:hypothetical protein